MTQILLLLLCVIPHQDYVVDKVDRIHINHHYSDKCELVYDQIIYENWKCVGGTFGFHVVSWSLLKNSRVEEQDIKLEFEKKESKKPINERFAYIPKWVGNDRIPHYDHASKMYIATFHDDKGVLRKILSHTLIYSHTQDDPETEDKKIVLDSLRKGLSQPIFRIILNTKEKEKYTNDRSIENYLYSE